MGSGAKGFKRSSRFLPSAKSVCWCVNIHYYMCSFCIYFSDTTAYQDKIVNIQTKLVVEEGGVSPGRRGVAASCHLSPLHPRGSAQEAWLERLAH